MTAGKAFPLGGKVAVRPDEGRVYGCPPGKGATAADLPLISRLRAAASPQGEAKARRRGCRALTIQ